MSNLETLRPCDACGVSVAAANGHENGDGTFLCLACYAARQSAAPGIQRQHSTRRCMLCDQIVPRKDCHKNRWGQYICLECQKQRKLRSSRRRFLRFSRRSIRYALIGIISVVIALAYAWLSIKVLNRVTQPPPEDND